MASFQIHEDQENRGREIRSKQNIGVFGNNRAILGALDNNIKKNERNVKSKQLLGISRQNDACINKPICTKLPLVPVVPVAQFEAFKVYEDSNEEVSNNVDRKLQHSRKPLAQSQIYSKNVLARNSEVILVQNSPMLIEKSPDVIIETISVCNASRNKDLFFEMEEYRNDIYQHLLKQETLHRPRPNYMRKQPDISHNMRTILIDWLVEVAEEYKLHTETLYLAVNYIDRFLSIMSVVRAKLQLVGTAAMFIASKYEEIYPPDVKEFVYITDDTYSKRQVIRMEGLILKVLDFDTSPPTAYTFITAMSIMNKLPEKTIFLAQYLSELALLETEPTLETLPSKMAAASIVVARHTLNEETWCKELEISTGYSLFQIQNTVEFLYELHKRAHKLPQQAIQEKYKTSKYLHVSTLLPCEEGIIFV